MISKFELKGEEVAVQRGLTTLIRILQELLLKEIELERTCRVAVLLSQSGVNSNNSIFHKLVERCVSNQKRDGGWLSVVETMWCTTYLCMFEEFSPKVKQAIRWLKTQRHKDGSWGRTKRDMGRIPVTALMLFLLPELASEDNLLWLEKEWKQEWNLGTELTYKGAFSLMAFSKNNYKPSDSQIITRIIQWLESEQNDDFGWGPFKNHPVGSTPFCTGVALSGLLQYSNKVNPKVLQNGLEWLKKNQLPTGLWADHYIEEGSAWSFFALSKLMAYLKQSQEGKEYVWNLRSLWSI